VALWLFLHDDIPTSVQSAQAGPIKSLYELGSLVGTAASLAGLSFIAYLLGSIFRWQPNRNVGRWIQAPKPARHKITRLLQQEFMSLRYGEREELLTKQLETFVSSWLRDNAGGLKSDDHSRILGDDLWDEPHPELHDKSLSIDMPPARFEETRHHALTQAYTKAITTDMQAVGIQLQAKNRDFWDTYDRHLAEAQFRYGVVPPLVAISLSVCFWFFPFVRWPPYPMVLFPLCLYLFLLGRTQLTEAAATLVQAIVLKMVEPPVLVRYREVVAKVEEERKRAEEERKRQTQEEEKRVKAAQGPLIA
jgi:hypothetical protein